MFISTDKACSPINVYGMCKAISERLYVDFANSQNDIKVCLCRYGNVLESTGSVIPFFKQLLEKGINELPITHKDMTRFLLTLDDAVDLIEWSYNHKNSHGKIVIPKIKALKITDIAKSLGRAYKHNDINLKYVGIRPGEKLHEAMISETESFRTKEYDDYFMITDNIINENSWSFSSDTSLMKSEETDQFLKKSKVI
jgi:UDP-N-acetylglucosamine 4,6-dehydratase